MKNGTIAISEKAETYWCIECDKELERWTIDKDKEACIKKGLRSYKEGTTWEQLQRWGYSCIPLELTKAGKGGDKWRIDGLEKLIQNEPKEIERLIKRINEDKKPIRQAINEMI